MINDGVENLFLETFPEFFGVIDVCIKIVAFPAPHKIIQFHHGFQNISIFEHSCEKFVAYQFHFLDCMLGF